MSRYDEYIRWQYRGGRPNAWARWQNRLSAVVFAAGIWPSRLATLEVRGRRSGRTISFPIVITDVDGERYLVSMLGPRANWVANVRAADGNAVLRHGRREVVHLEEIPVEERPPVIARYIAVAPGGRPHIPVDRHPSPEDLARVAPDVPVFKIVPVAAERAA